MEINILDAGDVAKQRLFNYLDEKIGKEDDQVRWEFFTYLLEQSKGHKLDFSGYGSLDWQQDRDEAKRIRLQRESERQELKRRKGRHF